MSSQHGGATIVSRPEALFMRPALWVLFVEIIARRLRGDLSANLQQLHETGVIVNCTLCIRRYMQIWTRTVQMIIFSCWGSVALRISLADVTLRKIVNNKCRTRKRKRCQVFDIFKYVCLSDAISEQVAEKECFVIWIASQIVRTGL